MLNVPRNANDKQIKKSYRKLAHEYHPDKNHGKPEDEIRVNEVKFQEISEAYEVLSDKELRGKYDRGEDVFPNQGGGRRPQHHHRRPHFNHRFGFGF